MKKAVLSLVTAFILSSCAYQPQMPQAFLGEWNHWEGYLRLTVNPDGTITDTHVDSGDLVEEFQYKTLHVYDVENVVILLKSRRHVPPGEKDSWGPPFLSLLFVEPRYEPLAFLGPVYRWNPLCFKVSEKEWQQPMMYKEIMLDRLEARKITGNDCYHSSLSLLWRPPPPSTVSSSLPKP